MYSAHIKASFVTYRPFRSQGQHHRVLHACSKIREARSVQDEEVFVNERGVPCIPTMAVRSETESYDGDDDDVLCMPYGHDGSSAAPASPGGNGAQGDAGLQGFPDRH